MKLIDPLHENCFDTKFFLFRILLYSDRTQRVKGIFLKITVFNIIMEKYGTQKIVISIFEAKWLRKRADAY